MVTLAREQGDSKTIHYYYSLIEGVETTCLIVFLNEINDDRLRRIIEFLNKTKKHHDEEVEKINTR